jgi:hypothetical protein
VNGFLRGIWCVYNNLRHDSGGDRICGAICGAKDKKQRRSVKMSAATAYVLLKCVSDVCNLGPMTVVPVEVQPQVCMQRVEQLMAMSFEGYRVFKVDCPPMGEHKRKGTPHAQGSAL